MIKTILTFSIFEQFINADLIFISTFLNDLLKYILVFISIIVMLYLYDIRKLEKHSVLCKSLPKFTPEAKLLAIISGPVYDSFSWAQNENKDTKHKSYIFFVRTDRFCGFPPTEMNPKIWPKKGPSYKKKDHHQEQKGTLAYLINYRILECLFTEMKCYKRSDVN